MSHYLLHRAARCRAADDDAVRLLRGGGTVETVDAGGGYRRRRGGGCPDAVRLSLQALQFLAGGSHVGQERGTGMQTGKDTGGYQARGVDIALPVVTGNDAALAPLIAQLQERVLTLGVQLAEHQCQSPAADGVAGGVGAGVTLALLVPGKQTSIFVWHST